VAGDEVEPVEPHQAEFTRDTTRHRLSGLEQLLLSGKYRARSTANQTATVPESMRSESPVPDELA
jgi:hypothetical protein